METFFRGSHTTSFVTCGFSRSYNQAAQVPSSNVTCNSSRSPWIKSRMMFALVSITHSITIFPTSFPKGQSPRSPASIRRGRHAKLKYTWRTEFDDMLKTQYHGGLNRRFQVLNRVIRMTGLTGWVHKAHAAT